MLGYARKSAVFSPAADCIRLLPVGLSSEVETGKISNRQAEVTFDKFGYGFVRKEIVFSCHVHRGFDCVRRVLRLRIQRAENPRAIGRPTHDHALGWTNRRLHDRCILAGLTDVQSSFLFTARFAQINCRHSKLFLIFSCLVQKFNTLPHFDSFRELFRKNRAPRLQKGYARGVVNIAAELKISRPVPHPQLHAEARRRRVRKEKTEV